jgi:RTX calcium-binding nonapeptide repeat (4 copies)
MRPVRRLLPLLLIVVLATAYGAAAGAKTSAQTGDDPCAGMDSGVQCAPRDTDSTIGGGDKVSHAGWPRINGVLAKTLDSAGHEITGGPKNDELLGHHGNDTVSGGAGKDVLWGDWDPSGNTTRQRDVLIGGAGDDIVYPSHGTTRVNAGSGADIIRAFYGKGTIDCGAGSKDLAQIRENGAFKTKNCEIIRHFCAFGSRPNGDCKQRGETLGAVRGMARRSGA